MDTDHFNISPVKSISALPYFTEADSLNKWILSEIYPYIIGRTLEIGSGLGSFSSVLIEKERPIHLSDTEENHREILREKFSKIEVVRKIHNIDFQSPEFEKLYSNKLNVFKTILSVNILDHESLDSLSIMNAKLFLAKEGTFILTVPVYTALFDESDQSVEDLKQSNWPSIKKVLGPDTEFMKARYFKLKIGSVATGSPCHGLFAIVIGRKNQ